MPTLALRVNGYVVDCEGDETSIANLEAEILTLAREAGMTAGDLSRETVLAFSSWSPDPSERERQTKILLYYALSLNIKDPDHPGRVRDYLPVHNFVIDISVTGRKVHVKLAGGGLKPN
jgi:hypothetical protein